MLKRFMRVLLALFVAMVALCLGDSIRVLSAGMGQYRPDVEFLAPLLSWILCVVGGLLWAAPVVKLMCGTDEEDVIGYASAALICPAFLAGTSFAPITTYGMNPVNWHSSPVLLLAIGVLPLLLTVAMYTRDDIKNIADERNSTRRNGEMRRRRPF